MKIKHPYFGTLKVDKDSNFLEGEFPFNDEEVILYLEADEKGSYDDSLKSAQTLFENAVEWEKKARALAVKEMLELKNNNWLDEDEEEIDAEEFLERITMDSIWVDPTGKFNLSFDDDDLFWGHMIAVSGSLSEGVQEANIE